ncbi:sugar ABC transporter [Erwinia sp. OLTSP20]|uniref:sugar ABC transporter ATP-binding protein n=1 Tax=unclassified Erwinia TaxID=2622719 RepID=UPI000C1A7CFC|nr:MULTISPECIES: sugar ABC transporter ATP-binding protein [unclassified Erwinia]PIJ50139.1 sugar ABC transporter [Erwinia sp. OAMSP11]PIJ71905.1 sugar ABC transporter [Erwinia sp. OLSSP12]PIJ81107.1 sugar ABC transporter [Erwinia sp. OLCASP19]PIJ83537.1 sugar ABC transporter [Erwinia sp. OLMTSP26]PIJ86152.1 sugar ABC transporter [Erwinia sp. OLMDSP33]
MPNIQPASNTDSPLLRISGLSKRFGATQALNNVSLQFAAGEVHCVLGENGAGKSTIGKIVSGLYPADEGSIWYDEQPVAFSSSREARHAGIVMVYQELSLAPDLSVRANLWLGAEQGKTLLSLTRKAHETVRVREVLAQLGLADIDMESAVGSLPVAVQQLIEIGKSLMSQPRLIIFDEPTAMLGAVEKENFFNVLRRLRQSGIASVLVTHHIDDVLAVSDKVTIMRNGQVVDAFAVNRDVTAEVIVARLTGKAAGSHRIENQGKQKFAPLLDFENLPVSGGGHRVFSVGKGEVVGIYGVVGCGGDTLLQNLVGYIATPRSASVRFRLDGYEWRPKSVVEALKKGVAWLPAGRASNCVYPTLSIEENLMMSQLGSLTLAGFLRTGRVAASADRILQRCGVKFADKRERLTSLSGGNQQKVLLARAMASARKLLVLEEPTAGVDIDAKYKIHQRIRALAAQGVSVMLLSSDLAETMTLCDTVWTMFHGSIVNTYCAPDEHDKASIIADVVGQNSVGAENHELNDMHKREWVL